MAVATAARLGRLKVVLEGGPRKCTWVGAGFGLKAESRSSLRRPGIQRAEANSPAAMTSFPPFAYPFLSNSMDSANLACPYCGEPIEIVVDPSVGRQDDIEDCQVCCCTANALAHGGVALGAVATEEALARTVRAGGFTKFRCATDTPFHRIFEARR